MARPEHLAAGLGQLGMPMTTKTWSSHIAMARRSSSTKSPTSIDGVENEYIASWFTQRRSIVLAIYRAAGRQHRCRRRCDPRGAASAADPDPAVCEYRSHDGSLDLDPRLGHDVEGTLMIAIGLVIW